MLFDSSKNKCILSVLNLLNLSSLSYSELFRKTKFSHITLQNSLKLLIQKNLIFKDENNLYKILERGVKLLKLFSELKKY